MIKNKTSKRTKPIRFIDLFCGVGGFRYAIQNAAEKLQIPVNSVYSSEIDKECQKTYKHNFGDEPDNDITKIEAENIPDHDILLAGFPCQPFSIIGNLQGFEDTRGTLFFDIARIIETKKPNAFILENVKLLIGHNKGKTIKRIMETLKELGYDTVYKVFNALDFGLPQKRERVFIVGFRNPCFFDWPNQKKQMKPLSDILETNVPQNYFVTEQIRKKRLSKQSPTKEITIWHENKAGNVSAYPYSCALRARASYNYLLVNGERRLTAREMLRLQGFPESFKIVSCYTQARKQAGNSLPIPVAEEIIKNVIKSCFLGETNNSTPKPDRTIIDGQLDLFENESKYNENSKTKNSRKIQTSIPA